MTKSICTFLTRGCHIRIEIEWEVYADFVVARDHIAKLLDATFLYSEEVA